MTLLEIMKQAYFVEFIEASYGHLWYDCCLMNPEKTATIESFKFRIPLSDLAGGTFPRCDDNPRYYQRWIHKELELQAQEAAAEIAKAKEEWNA